MCSTAEMCQNKQIDPLFFVMQFVSQRLTFNLRPNLEVKDYCEGQNLAKC